MLRVNYESSASLLEQALKLGDKFLTNERLIREVSGYNARWLKLEIATTEVMFLGYTNVYDGEIDKGYYDYETGITDQPSFYQTKTHRVLVVQPVHGTRFIKPFYILSQRQKYGYWDSVVKSTIAKEKEVEDRIQKRIIKLKTC